MTAARKRLDALKPSPRAKTGRRWTDEEMLGIVSAYQRGVSMAEIARTLDANRANIYSAVGSWALRLCRCHGLRKGEQP